MEYEEFLKGVCSCSQIAFARLVFICYNSDNIG